MSLNSGRTVQCKHVAQSLRLFGLHGDVNDAHRAGASRLQKKKKTTTTLSGLNAGAFEDDRISDSAELSCFVQVGNVR